MSFSVKSVVVDSIALRFTSYITYACKYLALSLATLKVFNLLSLTYIRICFCCALTSRKPFIILVYIMHLIGVAMPINSYIYQCNTKVGGGANNIRVLFLNCFKSIYEPR